MFVDAYGKAWIYEIPLDEFLVDINTLADPAAFFESLIQPAPIDNLIRATPIDTQLVPLHISDWFRNLSEGTSPELAAQLFAGELYCEWFSPAPVDVLRIALCLRPGWPIPGLPRATFERHRRNAEPAIQH